MGVFTESLHVGFGSPGFGIRELNGSRRHAEDMDGCLCGETRLLANQEAQCLRTMHTSGRSPGWSMFVSGGEIAAVSTYITEAATPGIGFRVGAAWHPEKKGGGGV